MLAQTLFPERNGNFWRIRRVIINGADVENTAANTNTSASPRVHQEASFQQDSQLIAETLAGKTESFGELVLKYQDRLYRTLYHLAGCHEDARDITQDALILAFKKLKTFQQGARFYTWLYRIAFNQFISGRRRRRPKTTLEAAREEYGCEPADNSPRPDQELLVGEEIQIVRSAMAKLNEEHQSVLILREMDGFRYDEIAEVLDVPVGTVRSRLCRARMQLRDLLRAKLGDEIEEA